MKSPFSWQLQEDEFVECEAIPVWDRGFRYGMSVFETILVHRGRMVFETEHLARLHEAATAAGFLMPVDWVTPWKARCASLGASFSGMMRVYITAGDGGPLAQAGSPRVYVLGEETAMPSAVERERGWRLHISRAPLAMVLGGWKTGNYWQHVQALSEAHRNGCDEAVVLDPAGNVVSASMGNLFVLIDGVLRTPPLLTGARDGVVRHWVLKNSDAREDLVAVDDLARATEAFVTNSRIGILPVRELDGRDLPSQSIGRRLFDTYRENVLAS